MPPPVKHAASWPHVTVFAALCAPIALQIINYDARKITPGMRAKVDRLLQAKGNSFEQQVW